jgi:outer membrane lipoprotein-sorting protein
MKKITSIAIITACMLVYHTAYSVTGEEAVAKFKSRMFGISGMIGVISWTLQSGMTYTGSFKYMAPGKLYIKFSSPSGKVLVSNGKKLWAYDSGSNICGIQDLGIDNSGGIAGLISDYMAIVTQQGSSGYTLKLKNSEKRYPEIILLLDGTYLLKKAILKNEEGDSFSFSLSNVDTKARVMNSQFNFNPPSNTQIVKNPMDIK